VVNKRLSKGINKVKLSKPKTTPNMVYTEYSGRYFPSGRAKFISLK